MMQVKRNHRYRFYWFSLFIFKIDDKKVHVFSWNVYLVCTANTIISFDTTMHLQVFLLHIYAREV